jgi:hypothetical protein
MRPSIPALVGLAACLAVANVLVSMPADADAIEQDPAPKAVPEGAALTGDNIVQQSAVHGVLVSLFKDKDGLQLHLHNPGEQPITLDLELQATNRSGSMISRMGPTTTTFEPIGNIAVIGPDQTVSWPLKLRNLQLAATPGGNEQPNMVLVNTALVVPNTEATLQLGPAGHLPSINRGDFSSWSVQVTATLGDKHATANVQLASL